MMLSYCGSNLFTHGAFMQTKKKAFNEVCIYVCIKSLALTCKSNCVLL